MKIKVICIGKTGKPFLEKGEKEYLNRLSHYAKVEKIEIPDLKDTKKLTIDQIRTHIGRITFLFAPITVKQTWKMNLNSRQAWTLN